MSVALLALSAAAAAAARPCDTAPYQGSPLCDTTKSVDDRAAWIVAQLTLDEKAKLLGNGAQAAGGLPAYQWWSEALHGVANSPGVRFGPTLKNATSFPQVIHTAASFNRTLFKAIGTAVSTEARAFNNVGQAGLTFWTPNVNLVRDPRWGRGQETPGEDVFLGGVYAANLVAGLQEGEDAGHVKVSACCKHFYGYDLENWKGVDRFHFDAKINARDETDTYLSAFHSCVKNARVTSLMCSYNAVNGVPSCANSRLLSDIARDAWGFDGYITGDCGAVQCINTTHNYSDKPNTIRLALAAGTDTDCGGFYPANVPDSVNSGLTPIKSVDRALVNLFKVQMRLGLFDPVDSQPYLKIAPDAVNTPAHQALALDAARQGVVLLKNTDGALPLGKDVQNVAVVGPTAEATQVLLGNYFGTPPYKVSPTVGIKTYAPQSTSVLSCTGTVACPSLDNLDAVDTAVKAADVAVLVVGLDQTQEAEGRDRTDITLPGQQQQLIDHVVAAGAGKRVIVAVMSGSSLDVSAIKANPQVSGIVWLGYAGQSGGQALADVLFGAQNPQGRLPITHYPADFTKVSYFDMGMRPNATTQYPGRTYRFYTGTAAPYVFGEGYSYTTFKYEFGESAGYTVAQGDVQAWCGKATKALDYFPMDDDATVLTVTAKVTNTGSVAGATAVQLFAKAPSAGRNGAPLKSLVAFDTVRLEAGASTEVTFALTGYAFALSQENGSWGTQAGRWGLALNFDDAATTGASVQ